MDSKIKNISHEPWSVKKMIADRKECKVIDYLRADRSRADMLIACAFPGEHIHKNPPKGSKKTRKAPLSDGQKRFQDQPR